MLCRYDCDGSVLCGGNCSAQEKGNMATGCGNDQYAVVTLSASVSAAPALTKKGRVEGTQGETKEGGGESRVGLA